MNERNLESSHWLLSISLIRTVAFDQKYIFNYVA